MYRKTILWALLAVVLAGVVSCSEKESASRYHIADLMGRWQYYTLLNPADPNSLQPGMAIELRQKDVAIVDGQTMRWSYEGNIVNALTEEGNIVRWLKFEVMEIDNAQGLMMVRGAHGWCENVSGTEWGTSRMAGHSWALEQPGFFARM